MNSTEKKLKMILFRHKCPTQMELGEFKLGLLAAEQHNTIAAHLEHCPHCQEDLQQINQAVSLPLFPVDELPELPDQPPSLKEKAKIFVINLLSPPPGILLDSSPQFAFRGEDEVLGTQVFQIDDYLVALSFAKDLSQIGRWSLMGDVTAVATTPGSASTQDWQAYLWQAEKLSDTVPLGEGGNFIFTGLKPSPHPFELILSSPNVEIHLQHLEMPGGLVDAD